MTVNETAKKMMEINQRKQNLLTKLVEPARAACNQMKDAGMSAGAGPLSEALYQIEVADQEMTDLVNSDPVSATEALISLIQLDKRS